MAPDDIEGVSIVRKVARAIAPVVYEELAQVDAKIEARILRHEDEYHGLPQALRIAALTACLRELVVAHAADVAWRGAGGEEEYAARTHYDDALARASVLLEEEDSGASR